MKVIELKPAATNSTSGFYNRWSTADLRKVRLGFERHFDATSSGEIGHPSTAWLSERLHVIDRILEQRAEEKTQSPVNRRQS
jgi:hypothetical protein